MLQLTGVTVSLAAQVGVYIIFMFRMFVSCRISGRKVDEGRILMMIMMTTKFELRVGDGKRSLVLAVMFY